MKVLTQQEFDALPDCRKGAWSTEREDIPGWAEQRHLYMGKRTLMEYSNGGTALLVEGLNFKVVSSRREKALALWAELAGTPIIEDEIQEPFLHFETGTNRFEIWGWFEDTFGLIVGEGLPVF